MKPMIVACAALVAGCALFDPPKPETVAVDTFCLTAKKRYWSINDSVESIRDAEVHNAVIDKRCPSKVRQL